MMVRVRGVTKRYKLSKHSGYSRMLMFLMFIALAMITVSISNSLYYNYYSTFAYSAATINVASTPQLPITRPNEFIVASDTTPNDSIYIRMIGLKSDTDVFNESILLLYAEEPDFCIPFFQICLVDASFSISLYDDQNNMITSYSYSGLLPLGRVNSPTNGAAVQVTVPLSPPAPITSTKTVKASVQCSFGC